MSIKIQQKLLKAIALIKKKKYKDTQWIESLFAFENGHDDNESFEHTVAPSPLTKLVYQYSVAY